MMRLRKGGALASLSSKEHPNLTLSHCRASLRPSEYNEPSSHAPCSSVTKQRCQSSSRGPDSLVASPMHRICSAKMSQAAPPLLSYRSDMPPMTKRSGTSVEYMPRHHVPYRT